MSATTPTLSPLAQRLQEMRAMRAYWLAHIDNQAAGYAASDPAEMLAIADRDCRQVAAAIIAPGVAK